MEFLCAAALFIMYCLVNLTCYYLRRRAERGTWSRPLVDNQPHQAPKKVG